MEDGDREVQARRLADVYGVSAAAMLRVGMPADLQERDAEIERIAAAYGVSVAAVRQVLEQREDQE